MRDRGPVFAKLQSDLLVAIHPNAVTAALEWVADAGLTDDPDAAYGMSEFIRSYVGHILSQLEQEWDRASGSDDDRIAQVLGLPLDPRVVEPRPADAPLH